jgi:hypothetical protein
VLDFPDLGLCSCEKIKSVIVVAVGGRVVFEIARERDGKLLHPVLRLSVCLSASVFFVERVGAADR